MSWEFTTKSEMCHLLVGNYFGSDRSDERALDRIQKDREKVAGYISALLLPHSSDVGLEIGSGSGFMAKAIGPSVRHLHCCDISESFLKVAQEYCSEQENISFHLANGKDLRFLAEEEVNFAYAHTVFIHLNIYQIWNYLAELSRVLKVGGRVYLDFVDGERAAYFQSSEFRVHLDYFNRKASYLTTLCSPISLGAIRLMGSRFGFRMLFSHHFGDGCTCIVFEKTSLPWVLFQIRRCIYLLESIPRIFIKRWRSL